jgi:hypothetical protein
MKTKLAVVLLVAATLAGATPAAGAGPCIQPIICIP